MAGVSSMDWRRFLVWNPGATSSTSVDCPSRLWPRHVGGARTRLYQDPALVQRVRPNCAEERHDRHYPSHARDQRYPSACGRDGERAAGRAVPRLSRVLVLVAPSADGAGRGGYHAVAPHMRGYGETEAPAAIEAYTLLHLVGDMVGLVGELGEKTAVIAGHDWGAPVAWHSALLRPDVFRGVIGLSVPHRPRSPVRPTTVMPQTDTEVFYQLYFQTPGVAEAELERDIRSTIRRLAFTVSGDAGGGGGISIGMVPRTGGFLTGTVDPETLPAWLTEADIGVYAAEFARAGFRGALNWYRNLDRNWELLAP